MKNTNVSFASVSRACSMALLTGALMVPAVYAQQTQVANPADSQSQGAQSPAAAQQPGSNGQYATGQPLPTESREGFWGHVNPFARKKWVHRQVDPVRDRVNELDEVQAKNSNDIRDVDSRATAGINRASATASAADQRAGDAANRANTANGLATDASKRTTALNGTVSNIDQYDTVSAQSLRFVAGRVSLTKKQKDEVDEMTANLATEKGYIIEVQGYSRAGVTNSQAMADSVVRYLVTEHQVPVYRIYRTGLGHTKSVAADGEKPLTNGVRVAILHNSLASMDGSAPAPAVPAGN